MPNKISIARFLFYCMFTVASIASGVLGLLWIEQARERFRAESAELRAEFLHDRKQDMQNEVNRVLSTIEHARDRTRSRLKAAIKDDALEAHTVAMQLHEQHKDDKSAVEIGDSVANALRPLRRNRGRGYYFAFDRDCTGQLYGINPELEGTSFREFTDPDGRRVTEGMLELALTEGEGFYEYKWPHPSKAGRHHAKISYVKWVRPLGWVLGTGDYLADVEAEVQEEILESVSQIRFSSEGFVFILDADGLILAHPNPELVGTRQLHPQGELQPAVLSDLMNELAAQETAYLEYGAPHASGGFCELLHAGSDETWGWTVGANVCLDTVEALIGRRQEALALAEKQTVTRVLVLFAAMTLLAYLAARTVSMRTEASFKAFQNFFEEAAARDTRIDPSALEFAEFQNMAIFANRMIERRQEIEEEVQELESQVRQADRLRSLGELAGGIAHDFNNQLGGIVGYADLLLQRCTDPQQKRYVEGIISSAEHSAGLTRQLLAYARKGRYREVIVDLNSVLQEVSELLLHTLDKRIHITTQTASGACTMRGDPDQIQNAILNIALNARDAIEGEGELRLRTQLRELDPAACAASPFDITPGTYVMVEIADTGHGMDEQTRDRMFDPFFTTKPVGEGTGMGLAAVYGTVKSHGGAIEVQSAPGSGTTLQLFWPQTTDADAVADAGETEGKLPQHVLLVEDEAHLRATISSLLKQLGVRVTTAPDGPAGMEAYRTHRNSIDVVLLDMVLPKSNGKAVFGEIRSLHPDARVVIISGFSVEADARELLHMGAAGFVQKPFRLEALRESLVLAMLPDA